MKKRIVSGIMAAAMAIVPFTGTGIKAVDNVINNATIVASAGYNSDYIVLTGFYLDGHYICRGTRFTTVTERGNVWLWGKSYYIGNYIDKGYLG